MLLERQTSPQVVLVFGCVSSEGTRHQEFSLWLVPNRHTSCKQVYQHIKSFLIPKTEIPYRTESLFDMLKRKFTAIDGADLGKGAAAQEVRGEVVPRLPAFRVIDNHQITLTPKS